MVEFSSPNASSSGRIFRPLSTLPSKLAIILLVAFSLFQLVAALSQRLCSQSNKKNGDVGEYTRYAERFINKQIFLLQFTYRYIRIIFILKCVTVTRFHRLLSRPQPKTNPNPEPPRWRPNRQSFPPPGRLPSPKLDPKHTAPSKPATVKPQNQVATTFKTVADKNNPAKWVAPTDTTTSTLMGISDLLENLPLETYLELTPRLHNSISSLPLG